MPKPAKQTVDARFTIFKGLPFYRKLMYKAPSGAPIEISGWIGLLTLKADVEDDETGLYTFSTSPGEGEGLISLSKGVIELTGTTDLDTVEWDQAVGHLVIGPTQDKVAPIALFAFDVQPSTTGVPPNP